jgi:hypothetical protein
MRDPKTQAEIFVYGLIHHLASSTEVIEWADQLLLDTESPDGWLLNLSSAIGANPKQVIELLHQVPGHQDEKGVGLGIAELRSRLSQPFGLFLPGFIPPSFKYPEAFQKIARSGGYLYNPEIEFINANSSYANELLGHVRAVKTSYIPFAKVDDRFYCFDAEQQDRIVIVDIVEGISSAAGEFGSWWKDYESKALCS